MKIGLLTYYYNNYGSYYQALALQKQIEALGHECEIIHTSIRGVKNVITFYAGILVEKVLPSWICRKISMRRSDFDVYCTLKNDMKKMKVSKLNTSMKRVSKKYDCIIVGGDTLWCVEECGDFLIYFGKDMMCPHISVGTCGITLDNGHQANREKLVNGLRSFEYLSGRDRNTCKWVKENVHKECKQLIDAALLNPFYANTNEKEKPYILVYAQNVSENHKKIICNLASKENLEVYCVAWNQPWCDKYLHPLSGAEFQSLFGKSRYCFVSTYHGIIFSAVHNKQFWALEVDANRMDRKLNMHEVLYQLNLENCLLKENVDEIGEYRIDYSLVNKRLETWRNEEIKWLSTALDDISIRGEQDAL